MILYLFFKIACLAVFMTCLTKLKYDVRKSIIIIVAFNIVIWIANYAIYVFMGIDFLMNIFPLTASVPAFICFFLVSKSKGIKVLFSFLTVTIYGMLTSFIGALPVIFFNSLILRLVFEFLSCVLLIVFIVKVFRKPYFKIYYTLEKGWGLLCLVPCLIIAMIYLLQYYPTYIQYRPKDIPVVFLVFALMFVFYTILYFNFENISQYYQLKQDRKILIVQTEMYKKEFETMMENNNLIKIYRHDMRHHIDTINTFLNDNNIAEVQKYISKLDDNLSKTVIEKYCENYGVNVILSSYINKAKDEQIDVISKAHISENIAIDDIELGLIFANALENAINACKKIENHSDRKIMIVCKEHCNQLYIQISNPFVGEVLFDGDYPISNDADHGIGTRSIAAITEKHGGVFSFTAQDGIFKTTIALKY